MAGKAKFEKPFIEYTDAICASYLKIRGEKYLWHGVKDTNALKRLLGVADFGLIVARWEWALKRHGYTSASTVSELATKWQAIAAEVPITFRQQAPSSQPARKLN